MTETIIESLQPFISQITDMPLPSIRGAGGKFYLEIEAIRCGAVNQICCALLARTQNRHGDEAAEVLRLELDSIRLELLAKFPDLPDLLAPETWPNLQRRH